MHGQPGGIGYRHWLGLTLMDMDEKKNRLPAAVITRQTQDNNRRKLKVQVWAFGYDMDNMKARGWCEARMPFIEIEDGMLNILRPKVKQMVKTSETIAYLLREAVKKACYGEASIKVDGSKVKVDWRIPSNVKSDTGDLEAIQIEFWLRTETVFYDCLKVLPDTFGGDGESQRKLLTKWHSSLRDSAESLFKERTETLAGDGTTVRRLVLAFEELGRSINARKLRQELGLLVADKQEGKRK